jgi:hypothetical protein
VVDRLVLDQEIDCSSAFAPTTPNSYLSLVYAAFIISTATTVCVPMWTNCGSLQETSGPELCPGSAVDVARVLDPTITEKSLRNFCRRYGAAINYDFLNRETQEWLQSSMDLVRNAGESAARPLTSLRKHARVVRR